MNGKAFPGPSPGEASIDCISPRSQEPYAAGVGDDGKTPAMRLGFTKAPLEYEDILWPGQRVPRPKAVRRRGKKAVAACASRLHSTGA